MKTQTDNFQIKIESFEGPLDLLLKLIESERMDVTSISLSKVANDFLSYLEKLEQKNVDQLAEFLDIASRLILIKSKVLLPQLELTEEEKEDIEELEKRLKQYQFFKKISIELKKINDQNHRGFARKTSVAPDITLFDPPKNVDSEKLFQLFSDALSKIPQEEKPKKTDALVEPSVSIEDKVVELENHFVTSSKVNFSHFLKHSKTKAEVIVSFLAILELLKLKKIAIQQDNNFSDIIITKKEDNFTINHEDIK